MVPMIDAFDYIRKYSRKFLQSFLIIDTESDKQTEFEVPKKIMYLESPETVLGFGKHFKS